VKKLVDPFVDLKSEIRGPLLSKLQLTVFFPSPIVDVVLTSPNLTRSSQYTQEQKS